MKTCPSCGLEEHRVVNGVGELVKTNLDPISGRCVACLSKEHTTFRSRRDDAGDEWFDAKSAAARNDA
jgi:hypothetical protein